MSTSAALSTSSPIPNEIIESKIFIMRGKKIMLDKDLAQLYGVTTTNLNKAVKRNLLRFPEDFMFQLSKKELDNLIFQIGTSSWGGTRKPPYAFTEQGVAMLSGILNSNRAVAVNIQIMRTFTKLREIMVNHHDLKIKIEAIIKRQESKFEDYDNKIQAIFDVINELLKPTEEKTNKKYGFLADR